MDCDLFRIIVGVLLSLMISCPNVVVAKLSLLGWIVSRTLTNNMCSWFHPFGKVIHKEYGRIGVALLGPTISLSINLSEGMPLIKGGIVKITNL